MQLFGKEKSGGHWGPNWTGSLRRKPGRETITWLPAAGQGEEYEA